MSEDHIDRIVDAIHNDYTDILNRDNRFLRRIILIVYLMLTIRLN